MAEDQPEKKKTSETALSKEDKTKFVSWLNERRPSDELVCTVCGKTDWILGDHLVAPPVTTIGGGVYIGGPAYPNFLLVCTSCGNTHFFNAVVAGFIPDAAEPEKKEGGDG